MQNNTYLLAAVFAALVLNSPSGVAAPPTACERILEYYGKSNVEMESELKTHREKLPDAEEFATKCASGAIQISSSEKGEIDTEEMRASARRLSNAVERVKAEATQEALKEQLSGFNFAAGIGALYLLNQPDIINTTVDNGILRTTSEEKYKLGLWLSTNSFFGRFMPGLLDNSRWGLFTAIQLGGSGGNEIVNSFAAGFSFASTSSMSSQSKGTAPLAFQFGYGLTRIQTYANGYSDGMTMPTGANQPVMKKGIGKGPVIIISTIF